MFFILSILNFVFAAPEGGHIMQCSSPQLGDRIEFWFSKNLNSLPVFNNFAALRSFQQQKYDGKKILKFNVKALVGDPKLYAIEFAKVKGTYSAIFRTNVPGYRQVEPISNDVQKKPVIGENGAKCIAKGKIFGSKPPTIP